MYGVLLLAALPTAALVPAQAAGGPPGPVRPMAAPADVVLLWNEVALAAVRAERTPPPLAARNLAMVHAAVYDAVNAVARTHRPFRVVAHPPPGTSPEAAAAIAAHRVLTQLYPRQATRFDTALDDTFRAIPDGPGKDEGVALGQLVAERVLAWRERDGSARVGRYEAADAPGVWRPTPPNFRPALLPQWPTVTCFALRSATQFRPPPPPELGSAAYAASLREVRDLGARDSRLRTAEQTEIARFWADGDGTATPPGHWNQIAQVVARSRCQSPAENARMFALLNLALADAGIACWDCKYHYRHWRPIQAVRAAPDGDPTWEPLLPTPPFPTYTSGHSTFSGAAAAALAAFCGTDAVPFTSRSDGLPGVTRSFPGFAAAAAEAGRSRIYGGIHFEFDNAEGLACGRSVGAYVAAHFLTPLPAGRP